jgi:trimethylamine--corrinoid protein Co-methyltransferase
MVLGGDCFQVRTSSGATGILDLESKLRRVPTRRDAAKAALLADALPHIDGVSTMAVQPADVPVNTIDAHAARIALENTRKPLGYICLNEALIAFVLDMFAAVAGGEEALRARPFLTGLVESTSPLRLVSSQMAVLEAFATRGLPLTMHAHPMAGLTAPVTLAGELVITHAEVLALVTIAQLIRPGTPVVYGMSSSVPDMRTGANRSGAVEIGLMGSAVAQLANRCGLPSVISCGSDALQAGPQSILERMITLLPPALAGVDLVNLSTLETKMSFSFEQLVLDDTLVGMVQRYLRGFVVEEETLAIDLIHEIGPGGAYVSAEHTLENFRKELLPPDLIDIRPREAWESRGRPNMQAYAREKAQRILAEHHPPPLGDPVIAQLDEIVESAEECAQAG